MVLERWNIVPFQKGEVDSGGALSEFQHRQTILATCPFFLVSFLASVDAGFFPPLCLRLVLVLPFVSSTGTDVILPVAVSNPRPVVLVRAMVSDRSRNTNQCTCSLANSKPIVVAKGSVPQHQPNGHSDPFQNLNRTDGVLGKHE